uniref:RRM domain-containing protein n=1 Tax=Anopheles atroparvus TaxID=41427 RepID=A0AAG5CRM9_ANOAO
MCERSSNCLEKYLQTIIPQIHMNRPSCWMRDSTPRFASEKKVFVLKNYFPISNAGCYFTVFSRKQLTMPVTWLGTTYPVHFVNGRCCIGPPEGLSNPSFTYEVYVTGIPAFYGPDELIPIFSFAGQVYKMRLMMNFDRTNRGIAYVQYVNQRGARRALDLNYLHVTRDHKLKVQTSVNLRIVYLENIDGSFDEGYISRIAAEILQVPIVKLEFFDTYAYLMFQSNDDAISALRILNNSLYLFGTKSFAYLARFASRRGYRNRTDRNEIATANPTANPERRTGAATCQLALRDNET